MLGRIDGRAWGNGQRMSDWLDGRVLIELGLEVPGVNALCQIYRAYSHTYQDLQSDLFGVSK